MSPFLVAVAVLLLLAVVAAVVTTLTPYRSLPAAPYSEAAARSFHDKYTSIEAAERQAEVEKRAVPFKATFTIEEMVSGSMSGDGGLPARARVYGVLSQDACEAIMSFRYGPIALPLYFAGRVRIDRTVRICTIDLIRIGRWPVPGRLLRRLQQELDRGLAQFDQELTQAGLSDVAIALTPHGAILSGVTVGAPARGES